jgi:hypothetical protein
VFFSHNKSTAAAETISSFDLTGASEAHPDEFHPLLRPRLEGLWAAPTLFLVLFIKTIFLHFKKWTMETSFFSSFDPNSSDTEAQSQDWKEVD